MAISSSLHRRLSLVRQPLPFVPLLAQGPQSLLFLLFMLNLVAEVAEEALELGMLARAIQR